MNKILSVSKYIVLGVCLFCVKLSMARQTTAMIDAGEQRNVAVYGMVEDMLTLKPVHNAQVTLLTPDSVVVDRSRVTGHDYGTGIHVFGYLFMLNKSGNYSANSIPHTIYALT